jgi:ubiquitin C-terminal hydrolase
VNNGRNGISVLGQGDDIADVMISRPLIDRKETKMHQPEMTTRRPPSDDEELSPNKGNIKLRIFGLENNRFYCYLNAVLQCMFSVAEF